MKGTLFVRAGIDYLTRRRSHAGPAGACPRWSYTAYQMDPDTQAITWTADRMTQGVSYYATELNESFLKVYT